MRNAGTYTHIYPMLLCLNGFPTTYIHTCTHSMNTYACTSYVMLLIQRAQNKIANKMQMKYAPALRAKLQNQKECSRESTASESSPAWPGRDGPGLLGPFPGVWNGFRLAAVTISGYLNCRTWAAINYKNDGTAQPNRRKSCLLRLFRIVQPSQAKSGEGRETVKRKLKCLLRNLREWAEAHKIIPEDTDII